MDPMLPMRWLAGGRCPTFGGGGARGPRGRERGGATRHEPYSWIRCYLCVGLLADDAPPLADGGSGDPRDSAPAAGPGRRGARHAHPGGPAPAPHPIGPEPPAPAAGGAPPPAPVP